MRFLHLAAIILLASILAAAATSVTRRGAVTVGFAALIVPLIFRLALAIALRGRDDQEKALATFDWALLTVWICLVAMIAAYGMVPKNLREGWPD